MEHETYSNIRRASSVLLLKFISSLHPIPIIPSHHLFISLCFKGRKEMFKITSKITISSLNLNLKKREFFSIFSGSWFSFWTAKSWAHHCYHVNHVDGAAIKKNGFLTNFLRSTGGTVLLPTRNQIFCILLLHTSCNDM